MIKKKSSLQRGFAEVQPDSITILVDSAQRADDLDEAKILKAKEEAEKLLSDKKTKRILLKLLHN